MAQISFFGDQTIEIPSTSGIGLYGSTFGSSVAVGSYQTRTFITNSTGTTEAPEIDNTRKVSASGVVVGSYGDGSGIHLKQLPNYLATLNIRFTHSSAVQTTNTKLYGYDRVSIDNAPSGIELYAAAIVHPNLVQDMTGSGSAAWVQLTGSGSYLTLTGSPGTSGYSPNGTGTSDTRHDYFAAVSATPTSVGAKLAGLYLSLEYL